LQRRRRLPASDLRLDGDKPPVERAGNPKGVPRAWWTVHQQSES